MENKELVNKFSELLKQDPKGAAIFWHMSYLIALTFIDEHDLRKEFDIFMDNYTEKLECQKKEDI